MKEAMPLYALHAGCMRNAVELKEEAELLLLSKRFARAVALAIFAYEELGKAQIVADRIDGCVSQQEFERAFWRHDLKAAYVSKRVDLEVAPDGQLAGGTIKYDLEIGKKFFKLRLDSMYVAWDGAKPAIPSKKITRKLAEKVVRSVKEAVEHELSVQYITERIGTRSQFR